MSSITVTVPTTPPSVLMPNQRRRRHWSVIAKASKECREIAYYAARSARGCNAATITGPVSVTIHVAYEKRRRVPDLDATIGGAKNLLDGVVDAGILADDWQVAEIHATHEKAPDGIGYTTFTIQELSA